MKQDSFFVMEGRIPQSGTVVPDPHQTLSHIHTHARKFHAAYLIQATAAELGVDGHQFSSPNGCDVVRTNVSTHYKSNLAFIEDLKTKHPNFFSVDAPDTRLICQAIGSTVQIGPYHYDRKSRFDCGARTFRKGDPFTSIAFFGNRHGETAAPAGICATAANAGRPQGVFPIHMQWFINFEGTTDTPIPNYHNQFLPLKGIPDDWVADDFLRNQTHRCDISAGT